MRSVGLGEKPVDGGRYPMTIMQIYKGGCKFQIGFIDFHQKGKCCIQADVGEAIRLLAKTQTIYWLGICDTGLLCPTPTPILCISKLHMPYVLQELNLR